MRDRPIAKQYVEEAMKELPEDQRVKHLKIMLLSEIETDAIMDGVLKPALAKIGFSDSDAMKLIFGVEGEYGRHYSFLKAVLAIYHAFIDPAVTATFKIDIDQVFVQDSLVSETGKSMLEHFKSDLRGAKRRRSRTSPTPRTPQEEAQGHGRGGEAQCRPEYRVRALQSAAGTGIPVAFETAEIHGALIGETFCSVMAS